MECDVCGGNLKEVFSCDACKVGLCKTCAELTSSEVKVLQLKDRVMIFHCKKCKSFETSTLLQNTIEDKSNIIASKDEIICLLKNKIAELEKRPNAVSGVMSYSGAAKMSVAANPNIGNVPSLIIKPKQRQNPEMTVSDLRKNINPSRIKIGIKGTRSIANGDVIIKCQTRGDLEILKKEADTKLPDYEAQISKLRKPRLKIPGYDGKLTENDLETCIKEQNPFIDQQDELHVTYLKQ